MISVSKFFKRENFAERAVMLFVQNMSAARRAAAFIVMAAAMMVCYSAETIEKSCQQASSGSYVAYNDCSSAFFKETDKKLNERYAETMSVANKHSNAANVTKALVNTQRAWLIYRDRTCELASWNEGYVYAPAKRPTCMSVLTERRIQEMEELRRCIEAEGSGGECPLSQ